MGTAVIVKNGIVEGKHVDGMNRSMMETMEENEVGMKVQGGHQAGLIGMMGDGNGKKHLGRIVIILADTTTLPHRQCLLVPHLMHD